MMAKRSVYLDYNATAKIRPEVIDLVTQLMAEVGNASSVHNSGRHARKYVEDARIQVAKLCNTSAEQVVFTSGATESINTVLSGFKDKKVLISAIEHPAVLAAAPHAKQIPVDSDGLIDMNSYTELLNEVKPSLVSIMLVNSETGVIQPIAEMAKQAHEAGALFHTDAVQGAGRIDISIDQLGVDYMSLSAHKMAGPQGVGAIIYKKGLELPKFMLGGGQEKNCRAGTHNTAGIAGMGLAAEIALQNMETYKKLDEMRIQMETQMKRVSNSIKIYGENAPRVGNTSNIGIQDLSAQTQMMTLDLESIAVSSGSACSSGSFKPSHVLQAMGCDDDEAKNAIRISMGWNTSQDDIDHFLAIWTKMVQKHQNN